MNENNAKVIEKEETMANKVKEWFKRNKTVKEVFETMDTDQRTVVYYLIGKATEELKKRRVIPMESDAQFTQGLLWNVGSKLNERGF